ncbi:phosphoribosylglycinamide formyltransferase [Magnetofaba australis]|uniref:phosphoribosylglycinamide formyltransferase n=1 Tax=Magnetofaba australis TaxID=1472297 RepID=UPI000A19F866
MPCRIAVLISGSGSNLQALMDRVEDGTIPGRIVRVISNKADAYGLTRAQEAGIDTLVIDHKAYDSREAFDAALIAAIDADEADLVCLAGFMRVLTGGFVRHYVGRLINVHPSLLPAFPGLKVQQKAIDAGVRFSGCTVHFVEEEVDAGPIIAQAVVPILPDDDASALAGRILKQEHRIYPLAVKLFAEGRLSTRNRTVLVDGQPWEPETALVNPPLPAPLTSAPRRRAGP